MRTLLLVLVFVLAPAGTHAVPPQDPVLVPVIPGGLAFPVAVRHSRDGSGRLFIVEQDGLIRIWRDGTLLPAPFLDLSAISSCCGERGLLGLDFHPNYAINGLFYVYYTDNNGDSVIAEYAVSAGDEDLADPASARVVLNIDQDFGNHNGGDIHFGLDGMLYIAMGDGGYGNDYCNRAQTLDPALLVNSGGPQAGNWCAPDANFTGDPDSRALLGKMLRIDVNARDEGSASTLCGHAEAGSAPYGVPADNPYVAPGDPGCDEIWASGLRNPFRFSVDRLDGSLFIGDVGQFDIEEINHSAAGEAGLNFGWRCLEGTQTNDNALDPQGGDMTPVHTLPPCTGDIGDPLPGTRAPILEYPHPVGCAVTGGYRYRGDLATLHGTYIYADYCSARIWFANETGGPGIWTSTEWADLDFLVSAFGEDEQGELYLLRHESPGGGLYRFGPDRIFEDGIE